MKDTINIGILGLGVVGSGTVAVLERNGDRFRASMVIKGPDLVRIVKGMVKGGMIRWSRNDVEVIEGRGTGPDHSGIVFGDKITLYFQGTPDSPAPAAHGRVDLALER